MTDSVVTSLQNQRVKNAIKLRDRRQRDRQQRFVIDGASEIIRAIGGKVPIVEAFVCERLCVADESRRAREMLERCGAEIIDVSESVFEKLAFGHRPQGVLAVAPMFDHTLDEITLDDRSLVVVLEGVEKPGNIGAVMRSADAAGVSAMVIADGGTDLFNPNCIRASLGTLFTLSVCCATSSDTLSWLRKNSFAIYATRVGAGASYLDADYRGLAAIVLGSEADGLSERWKADDVRPIGLPMLGVADSLNISATAAVLFYEALRQRKQ